MISRAKSILVVKSMIGTSLGRTRMEMAPVQGTFS